MYVQQLFFENRAVYELKWKNIVVTGRQQMKYDACALHTEHLSVQTHHQDM
jgi:hypothetical protein